MDYEDKVHFKISNSSIEVVKVLRKYLQISLSEIRKPLIENSWFEFAELHGNDHEIQKQKLLGVVQDLKKLGITPEVMLGGEVSTLVLLHNILNRWDEIGKEQEMFVDFELGSPCIETLEYAKGRMKRKDFLNVLQSFEESNLEPEVISWIKKELEKD